ncbi:MAG: hypothetical protein A2V72_01690 [Candidatus Nealsonbacteria bacterium RBG_13_37_56]|uniref:SHS2 domain-containing protein n=1 Tax=Candidatus Nealsonbacteria bacterium RBG_13_37_56 TaxID=1801661 RepID=A0A1G2DVD4_9BACT|nr:MAG: hypothetical protein A2V72_01690 [Candidatus Nealsonbacteria bacterium RBG_13_37_56]
MRFSFFKKKETPFLVLDIGTEAIKALLLEKKDKEIVILNHGLYYLEEYGVFNGNDFETEFIKRGVVNSLELITKEKKDLKNLPVLLSLPPDILRAKLISQLYKRDSDSKVSKKEEKFIIKQVLDKSKKQVSARFAEKSGIMPDDIHWINFSIVEVKINGYPVSNLCGCQERDLEISVLAVFLPKHYFKKIQKIFEDLNLKISKIAHLVEVFQNGFSQKIKNGTFIDLGGKFTQGFLIKDNNLKRVSSFETGGHDFTQRLSEALGIDHDSARLLKEKYSGNLLTREVNEKVREIFLPEKKILQQDLQDMLKKIKSNPPIYIFGGSSLIPEIKESIKYSKIIRPKSLKYIEDTTKNLKSPQYIPSLLIARYAKEIL